MVAYKLKNTVSPSGAVTRGVCSVRDGLLEGVTETYKITLAADGSIFDGDSGLLDTEALVSMNLWGFGADIFDDMRERFFAFLRELPDGELKSEYALPTMIDAMLKAGELKVHVLDTNAVWFGVTYREDREGVAAALKAMHDEGKYPESLRI